MKVKMQGWMLTMDTYVLVLGGCGMVLGVQWLKTIATISRNFNDLSMRFEHGSQEVQLG